MGNDKGKWFRCYHNGDYNILFTLGKLYKCLKENVNDFMCFIDDQGDKNGWESNNHKHFIEATQEELIANNIIAEVPPYFNGDSEAFSKHLEEFNKKYGTSFKH